MSGGATNAPLLTSHRRFRGSEIVDALAQTSFTGITGPLSFSPVHRGREEGITVIFKNNKGEAGPQNAGSWTTEGFEYPQGFTEEDIVWSTASGTMPKPFARGENAGIAFIVGIMAGAAVAVAAFCGFARKREKDAHKVEAARQKTKAERLARQATSARSEAEKANKNRKLIEEENAKLQEDVALLQQYNQSEVAMLEERVKGFQADLAKVEEATGAAEHGMQRLMIRADELKGK